MALGLLKTRSIRNLPISVSKLPNPSFVNYQMANTTKYESATVWFPMTGFLRHGQVKYEHLVAGVAGGVVSTAILHPLDTIRTRLAGAVYTNNEKSIDDYVDYNSIIISSNIKSERQSVDLSRCWTSSIRGTVGCSGEYRSS